MYYLPLRPYWQSLSVYWLTRAKEIATDDNFWTWVEKEHKAKLAFGLAEKWMFKNEQDMIWFALRWS